MTGSSVFCRPFRSRNSFCMCCACLSPLPLLWSHGVSSLTSGHIHTLSYSHILSFFSVIIISIMSWWISLYLRLSSISFLNSMSMLYWILKFYMYVSTYYSLLHNFITSTISIHIPSIVSSVVSIVVFVLLLGVIAFQSFFSTSPTKCSISCVFCFKGNQWIFNSEVEDFLTYLFIIISFFIYYSFFISFALRELRVLLAPVKSVFSNSDGKKGLGFKMTVLLRIHVYC